MDAALSYLALHALLFGGPALEGWSISLDAALRPVAGAIWVPESIAVWRPLYAAVQVWSYN